MGDCRVARVVAVLLLEAQTEVIEHVGCRLVRLHRRQHRCFEGRDRPGRGRLAQVPHHRCRHMIAQGLTHASPIRRNCDAEGTQMIGGPDSRQHHQLGRLEGTGGQDHFPTNLDAAPCRFRADRPAVANDESQSGSLGPHLEMFRQGAEGMEIGDRG